MRDGLLARFGGPEELVAAAREIRKAGYEKLDAYTPHPMPELEEVLELPKSPVFALTLFGGMFGAAFGYFFQYYSRVMAYPLDVGGRPLHPWPTFIPITFEMTVLFAGLFAFFSCWALSGLPRLYHPLDETDGMRASTIDGFFLTVDAEDPFFDRERTEAALRALGAIVVEGVGRCR